MSGQVIPMVSGAPAAGVASGGTPPAPSQPAAGTAKPPAPAAETGNQPTPAAGDKNADPSKTDVKGGDQPGSKQEGTKPDTTGKPNEGPVPYERFKEINEGYKKLKAEHAAVKPMIDQIDSVLSQRPDIAAMIMEHMSGEAPTAKPPAGEKQGNRPGTQKQGGNDLAAIRDAVTSEFTGVEGSSYDDLSTFEKKVIDKEIQERQSKAVAAEEQRAANVQTLRQAITALETDPVFEGIKIDHDELVLYMDENAIRNPRDAAFLMFRDDLLDRTARKAAETALTRKAEAQGAALDTGGGGSPQPMPQGTTRLQQVMAKVEEIRARRNQKET